jgi:hypothetical protein
MTGFLKVPSQQHREAQCKRFCNLLGNSIKLEDCASILDVMDVLSDFILTAPASSKFAFHNAYPGGWLDHTLTVHDNLMDLIDMYEQKGGTNNINRESASKCALLHDFGKLGDGVESFYLPETQQKWLDMGYLYKRNPKFSMFTTNDMTMYLLQRVGITLTMEEIVAIKCTDGMYDKENEKYLMSKNPFAFDNNLPYLLHWADHMATLTEKDEARRHLMNSKQF